MMEPDRVHARDSAVRAMLPLVPQAGWTLATLRQAVGEGPDLLFPGGPAEMVEAYIDMADRDMVAASAPLIIQQRLSQRVRTLIATRLDQAEPHKIAVRRAVSVLARPVNAARAAHCTARTVDVIWHEAGDLSANFSWYTKRATLAGVYASTLLFWLNGACDRVDAVDFLDRRLAGVARFGKLRRQLAG